MMRLRLMLLGMLAIILLASLPVRYLKGASPTAGRSGVETPRPPVLVELFTSEGCSSCPPADALLERLDRSQPTTGAELIVLSEHVDYWNDIGWKDPFSSHEYSERQSAYAHRFGLSSVYTPQLVVDGHVELVGSDERRTLQAVENAAKVEKAQVRLSSIRLTGANELSLHIEAGPLPPSLEAKSAYIILAVADDSDESQVSGGENAGSTLKHVAVLRGLVAVGTVEGADKFSQDVTVNLDSWNRRDLRIVGIIQEPAVGRVLGAGLARLSN